VKHSIIRKLKKQHDRRNITVLSVSHPHIVFIIFKRLEFQTFPCYCRFPLIKLQINKCASIIIKINHNIFYDFIGHFSSCESLQMYTYFTRRKVDGFYLIMTPLSANFPCSVFQLRIIKLLITLM
jgi:hypothetical protein